MTPPQDAETLLAQTIWLRQLALHLLREPHAADDVVQDTWVAALERGPRVVGHGPSLRAWLARTATNAARLRLRGGRRRASREQIAARAESVPSTADVVERIEAQRVFADAVLALEAADRDVVVLRYFEALPPRAIARRLGTTGPAVRSRLTRALGKLRARLEARCVREGRSGAGVLLAVASAPARRLALAGSPQAVALSILAGAALVTALLWVAWPMGTGEGEAPPARRTAPRASPVSASPSPPRGNDAPPRRDLRAPPAATAGSADPSVEAPAAQLVVHARCVDPAGVPLAGMQVVAADVVGRPAAASGPDGRAVLTLAWPPKLTSGNAHWIFVEATGPARTRLRRQESVDGPGTIQLGDLVLGPGGAVHGFVRELDGTPVSHARLWVAAGATPGAGAAEEQRRVFGRGFRGLGNDVILWGTTDARGAYRFDGVPACAVSIVVRHGGRYCAYTPPFTVVAGGETQAPDVVLEPVRAEHTIGGVVRDQTGEVLPGANVEAFPNRTPRNVDPSARAQARAPDGRFELTVLSKSAYTLEVEHPRERRRTVIVHDVAAGTRDVEIAFAAPRVLEVVAADRAGAALAGARAHVTDEHGLRLSAGEPRADGSCLVAVPSVPFRVGVTAPRHLGRTEGPFAPDEAPERLVVRLEPAPRLHGRVVAHGQPVAGARVHLHAWPTPPALFRLSGELRTRLEAPVGAEAASDASGRFELYPWPGAYVVHAEAPGFGRGESAAIEIDAERPAPAVELVLSGVAALEGRVLAAAGEDPQGTLVGATRGDGHVLLQLAGEDGRFRFDGLAPGGWQVRRCDPRDQQWLRTARTWPTGDMEPLPVDVELHAGRTVRYDLDLTDRVRTIVQGRITLDGAPAAGWRARVWQEGMVMVRPVTSDAAGAFEAAAAAPGPAHVSLRAPSRAGGELLLLVSLELQPGVNVRAWELTTGGVELRALPSPEEPDPELAQRGYALVWRTNEGMSCEYTFDPDADGAHHATGLPVGRVELRRRPARQAERAASRPVVGELEIAAGEEVRFSGRRDG